MCSVFISNKIEKLPKKMRHKNLWVCNILWIMIIQLLLECFKIIWWFAILFKKWPEITLNSPIHYFVQKLPLKSTWIQHWKQVEYLTLKTGWICVGRQPDHISTWIGGEIRYASVRIVTQRRNGMQRYAEVRYSMQWYQAVPYGTQLP